MADEAHLRAVGERCRPGRYARFFRLGMEHGRIGRGATEQCPGIQTDAFHAAIKQQAIELPFGIALGKEVSVTDLPGPRSLKGDDETRKLRRTTRGKSFGESKPQRPNTY